VTACYQNALALLDDARTLAKERRWPRSLALTVLALEELGKVVELHGVVVAQSAAATVDWQQFWKSFRDHKVKQGRIAAYGRLYEEAWRQEGPLANQGPYSSFLPEDIGRLLDFAKQACLYVNFSDGVFTQPGQSPELPSLVDDLFSFAEERCDSFEWMHLTVERSKDLIEAHAAGIPIPPVSIRGPASVDWLPNLHSMIANRSSALIPDYASTYALAEELLGTVDRNVVGEGIATERSRVERRLEDHATLPSSAQRAWQMLKLLYGVAEKSGIPWLASAPTNENGSSAAAKPPTQ
jgi:AbiV family abortive infection protein